MFYLSFFLFLFFGLMASSHSKPVPVISGIPWSSQYVRSSTPIPTRALHSNYRQQYQSNNHYHYKKYNRYYSYFHKIR